MNKNRKIWLGQINVKSLDKKMLRELERNTYNLGKHN